MHPEPDPALRRELSPILTRDRDTNKTDLPPEAQQAIIQGLSARFPHSIVFVMCDAYIPRAPATSVNCYEYAFGLYADPRYWEIVLNAYPPYQATGLLVGDLITKRIMEPISAPSDGAVAVYRTSGRRHPSAPMTQCYSHVGLVRGLLVRSKWGPGGCVWDHAPLEVPEGFGALVGYFRLPTVDQVRAVFAEEMRFSPERMRQCYEDC